MFLSWASVQPCVSPIAVSVLSIWSENAIGFVVVQKQQLLKFWPIEKSNLFCKKKTFSPPGIPMQSPKLKIT